MAPVCGVYGTPLNTFENSDHTVVKIYKSKIIDLSFEI
jgi:hypothetical protein